MLRSRALQETSLSSVLVSQTTKLDFQFYEPAFICVTGRLDMSLNRLSPPLISLVNKGRLMKGELVELSRVKGKATSYKPGQQS